MTYPDGQIGVRVALSLGPNDMPVLLDDPDWTDLTSRVKSYRDRRGRDDALEPFQPGTATVVLDNGDRALDPSNTAGLLWDGSDPIGLPLCPVKITQWLGGTEYVKFTGYIAPEAWPGDIATQGESGETVLNVVDALGHSPVLPPDIWGLVTSSLQPESWFRMDLQQLPVLDDESEVPDNLSAGVAVIEGTTGISRPASFETPQSGLGVAVPGLLLSGDHQLRIPASIVMPDGDEDKFSVWLWWSSRDAIPAGEVSRVIEMSHPLTGIRRWSVYVDGDDGLAYVTTFDAAGDPVDTATISPPFGITRWDDDGAHHMVTAIWDAGDPNKLEVWFGGISDELAIPGDLYESDIILGPNEVDTFYDELTTWRRVLVYASELAPVMLAFGQGGLWSGDTPLDRLGRYIECTGRTVTSDDTNEMHFTDDTMAGLWGLLRPRRQTIDDQSTYIATTPRTLADAYQVTVESFGGARWATKDGFLRARSIHALTDGSFTANYQTPCRFTDQSTGTAGYYRHAGVEVTGLNLARIINDASVTYQYSPDGPPDVDTSSDMTNRAIDRESIDRYGIQPYPVGDRTESAWCDWVLNQQLAELKVERFAQPHQEVRKIHLDPTGTSDDADELATWLITTCELELACEVVYTPAAGDPVLIEDLNIQQIETEWTPERWSVDLVAAKS